MDLTDKDKLKALAIINIFETSRPFGDPAACVVLNDGAGISYGICQFTHRSGALQTVVDRYLRNGGRAGAAVITACLPALADRSPRSIANLAANGGFRSALKAAAATPEMRAAQAAVAMNSYLTPALKMEARLRFRLPLSLAVIFDSIVQGSFCRVARGVQASASNEEAWITEYVHRRDGWLASYPRLKATRYRTRFFLNQIAAANWQLALPISVQGVRLTNQIIDQLTAVEPPAAQPQTSPIVPPAAPTVPAVSEQAQPPTAEDPDQSTATPVMTRIDDAASAAADKFDRAQTAIEGVTSRTDAVKSIWATIGGTVWQAVWAVFGLLAGIPREIWITAAVVAAALTLLYLYRQIELGRIRERRQTGAAI